MDLIKKQKKYLQYRDHYVIINNVRKTFSKKNFRRGCEAMGILRCPTSIGWDTIDAKKKSFTKKKETRMDRTAAVWKMGTR